MDLFFSSGPGPDFIYISSGSGFNACSPGPGRDFINGESRSESGFHSGPASDSIHFCFRVWVLSCKSGSRFESWPGFNQACPCPGPRPRPDITNAQK